MGRAEKKFQKRKERERAVRKKILKKREASHVLAKQIEAQDKLEHEVNKAERRKQQPFRNLSPAMKEAMEKVQAITDAAFEEKDPDVDKSDDVVKGPTRPVMLRKSKYVATSDDVPVTDFAPKYSAEATLEPLGK